MAWSTRDNFHHSLPVAPIYKGLKLISSSPHLVETPWDHPITHHSSLQPPSGAALGSEVPVIIVFPRDRKFKQKSLPGLKRNHCSSYHMLYMPWSHLGLLKFCFQNSALCKSLSWICHLAF